MAWAAWRVGGHRGRASHEGGARTEWFWVKPGVREVEWMGARCVADGGGGGVQEHRANGDIVHGGNEQDYGWGSEVSPSMGIGG